MKKNLIWVPGAIALALTVAGSTGCKTKAAVAEKETKVAVKVAEAVSEVIPQDVEFTANIEPWQKNYIIPALQGARINRIYVKVGDKVRKGQLVAEMDPTQYNTTKVQFETARDDYERVKRVYEAGGVSAQQLQQAEAQYLVYKETLANVAKQVRLLSPIDGVVTNKGEEEGNLFTSTPILEIMQMNRLKIHVNISEQYYSFVKTGSQVRLSVDLFPGELFDGKVSLIYPAIDPTTRTFTIEVTIPNAGNRLRPGMFARCTINMGDKEAVMVPDTAVQKQIGSNERFVYVITSNVSGSVESGLVLIDGFTAHRRTVEVGRLMDNRYDILSGVNAGDRVAVTSFTKLNNGTEVTINN